MHRTAPPLPVTASGWAPPMPPSPAVRTHRPARLAVPDFEVLVGDLGERRIRALQDALGADVDPRAGGHLAVHRQAQRLELAEVLRRRPLRHQLGVGDEHARGELVGPQDADGLAALHQQRVVGGHGAQRLDDRVEAAPVAGRLAVAAVDDEVLGALGDLRVEVVVQHPQRGLGAPASARCDRRRAAPGRREPGSSRDLGRSSPLRPQDRRVAGPGVTAAKISGGR